MAVESAADRAALFDLDEFAVAGSYQAPGGDLIPCTIIHDRGRREPFEVGPGDGSGLRTVYAWERAMIRADEVALVEQRATVMIATESVALKIVGKPKLDESGEIWTVFLERQGS